MATPAQIREHYDSLALIYQTFWGDHIHHGLFVTGKEAPEQAQLKLLDHCIALVKPGGGKVLDVGCGHGGTSIRLASRCGCEVMGLTISEKQARLARENAARAGVSKPPQFLVHDAETFAYPLAAFDVVWTMESSEHFADKRGYLSNVEPTLRRGGKLLLAAWTGSMQSEKVAGVARAFLCPQLWTAGEYRTAIENTGMRVTHQADLTAQVVRTWEICRERARLARATVVLLPRAARDFVEGIDVILDAYRSGELTYTVMVAEKV